MNPNVRVALGLSLLTGISSSLRAGPARDAFIVGLFDEVYA